MTGIYSGDSHCHVKHFIYDLAAALRALILKKWWCAVALSVMAKAGNTATLWVNIYPNSCTSTQQNIIQQWKETNCMWNHLESYQGDYASSVEEGKSRKVTYLLSHLSNTLKNEQNCELRTYFFSCQGGWDTNG